MNNTPIYVVRDEYAFDGIDVLDEMNIGSTCEKCRRFQETIKASGCDVNCPLYGVDLTNDK